MKLDQKLNLIVPVEQEGSTIYVHATPISREVFERHFLVLSKTFAEIYSSGLGITAGPRVAALLLKKVSTEAGLWDGSNGVEANLMAEIRRLANVVKGNDLIPYQQAVTQKIIDADDAAEVDNALTFFTLAYAMHTKRERRAVIEGAAALWGAQTTSLDCTGFRDSLRTSTATASSPATPMPTPPQPTPAASVIPS